MEKVTDLINKFGFPIVMAVGMGYIIKYVWEWSTKEVKPVIGEANTVLVALIDRIRVLDNDLIRLNQKVNTVLHLRGKTLEWERIEAEYLINQNFHDKEKKEAKEDLAEEIKEELKEELAKKPTNRRVKK
jgi:hypothetical protein